ncbi:MAG: serine/threonine protein kinase, partial [Planctomycetes bacterium]|nr:serine/threonine protein kinase [Planctomycetota bacterium]
AHEAGIIHRDIKPSNIVLDGDNPCIVDFSLARDGDDVSRTTLDGHVSGTLLYMSPEQLRSGGSTTTLDARTDVYSLSATLYELLTGHPAFDGDNPGKVIHQILDTDPAPPGVARDLATIVMRGLDKDREQRFPSALAMAEDLERYLAGEPILSRPIGLTTRVWKLARRNRTAALLLAAVVLVACVLAVSLGWTMRQQALAHAAAVANVREEIAHDRLVSARKLLDQLLLADASDPEVDGLRRSVLACEQLDELLDQVQSLPEDSHPDELRAAALTVTASDLPEHRRHELQLAIPLALAISGDLPAARELTLALPPSHARESILAAIRTAENHWQGDEPWPEGTAERPIEHLITVLAMRLAHQPLQARREVIARALLQDESEDRLLLQNAIQLLNEGRLEESYGLFRSRMRDGVYPRIVRRRLLFLAIRLGRDDEAAAHLAAFRRDHPQDRWTAADAAHVLNACYWLGRPEAAGATRELLTWARRRWPEDSQLAILEVRELTAAGNDADLIKARELLVASIGWARTEQQRETTVVTLLQFDAFAVPPYWDPCREEPTESEVTALQSIGERAGQLAERTKDEATRLAAITIAARARLAGGDFAAADEALSRCEGDEPEVVLERAQQAISHSYAAILANKSAWHRRIRPPADSIFGAEWQQHLLEVRPRSRQMLEAMPSRQVFHGRPAMLAGWLLEIVMANLLSDRDGMRHGIDMAKPLVTTGSEEEQVVGEFERLLGG